jgi:hypothetical protein
LLIEDFPALQKLAGFRPDYLFAGTQAPVYSVPVLKDSRTRMDAAQPADMGAGSPISSG